MRIAIITNHDWAFISHRLPIAIEAIKKGHEVYLVSIDTGRRKEIEKVGVKFVDLPMNPTGTNPVEEMRTLMSLIKSIKRIKPDVIHTKSFSVRLNCRKNTGHQIGGECNQRLWICFYRWTYRIVAAGN